MRDPNCALALTWQVLIIGLNTFVFGLALSAVVRLSPYVGSPSLAAACLPVRDGAAAACPSLSGAAAVSACRTQLAWGLAELVQQCSVWLALLLALAGVHWIKYMELVSSREQPLRSPCRREGAAERAHLQVQGSRSACEQPQM